MHMAVLENQSHVHHGLTVTYKERPSRQDRGHLIVVFSGFRPPESPYDFDGPITENLRSHMLWILDDFDGEKCYYIRNKEGFAVADAVNSLIESKREQLGLRKDQCTFMGFSKGGSAALFHGLAYDYPNILITAPRIRLGSGNVNDRPEIINAMTETGTPEEVAELDAIIPDLISESRKTPRNIYLFSSLDDHFHSTETGPVLDDLRSFSNFNYFETDSDLVRKHKDVTLYNMPLVMSILAALGEGTPPSFGETQNGGRISGGAALGTLAEVRAQGELITEIGSIRLEDAELVVSGVAFCKGFPVSSANDVRTDLELKSSTARHSYRLLQVVNDRLSNRYYKHEFCDYSYGAFASDPDNLKLDDLPFGRYELQLKVRHAKVNYPRVTVKWGGRSESSVDGEALLQLRSTPAGAVLVKRPLISAEPSESFFSLDEAWLRDGTCHVAGSFVIAGYEAGTYQDVQFYAVFVPRTLAENVGVALYSTRKKTDGQVVHDPWGVYTHSHFSTRRHGGFRLPKLAPDWYDIVITAVFATGGVFSFASGAAVHVDSSGEASLSVPTSTETIASVH